MRNSKFCSSLSWRIESQLARSPLAHGYRESLKLEHDLTRSRKLQAFFVVVIPCPHQLPTPSRWARKVCFYSPEAPYTALIISFLVHVLYPGFDDVPRSLRKNRENSQHFCDTCRSTLVSDKVRFAIARVNPYTGQRNCLTILQHLIPSFGLHS